MRPSELSWNGLQWGKGFEWKSVSFGLVRYCKHRRSVLRWMRSGQLSSDALASETKWSCFIKTGGGLSRNRRAGSIAPNTKSTVRAFKRQLSRPWRSSRKSGRLNQKWTSGSSIRSWQSLKAFLTTRTGAFRTLETSKQSGKCANYTSCSEKTWKPHGTKGPC